MNDSAGLRALEPGARTFCCVAVSEMPAAGAGGSGGRGSGALVAAGGGGSGAAGGGDGAGGSSLAGGTSLPGDASVGGGGVSGGGVSIGCCSNQRKQNRCESIGLSLAALRDGKRGRRARETRRRRL